jgi:hypothetical protein
LLPLAEATHGRRQVQIRLPNPLDLDAAYAAMADDEAREAEALAIAEATIGDIDAEAW